MRASVANFPPVCGAPPSRLGGSPSPNDLARGRTLPPRPRDPLSPPKLAKNGEGGGSGGASQTEGGLDSCERRGKRWEEEKRRKMRGGGEGRRLREEKRPFCSVCESSFSSERRPRRSQVKDGASSFRCQAEVDARFGDMEPMTSIYFSTKRSSSLWISRSLSPQGWRFTLARSCAVQKFS